MALPMVHLLAAWRWAQDKPELKTNPDYYLGAVSPDAIHIRDGNDKSRKNEIHLNNWRYPDPDSVLEYWLNRHTPFDLGYGIHVLLDGQWAVEFRRRFPEMLLPDGRLDTNIYYNDTIVTDFGLYRDCELTPFFMDMIQKGTAPADHPQLRLHEFEGWRDATLKFYQRECPMNNPVRFIGREYVFEFLDSCLNMMNTTYERMLNMNATQKSILDRRSNRGYSDEKLTQAEIQTLIDAALASPTACNFQDWNFIFVTNRELMDQFSVDYLPMLLEKSSPEDQKKYAKYDLLFHAPLLVIITLPKEPRSRFAQVDAGIAVQNLALSAQGMGLGSVILGRPKDVFTSEKGGEWMQKLGFAPDHEFAIAIAIGHPTVTKDAHPIAENKVFFVE